MQAGNKDQSLRPRCGEEKKDENEEEEQVYLFVFADALLSPSIMSIKFLLFLICVCAGKIEL